MSERELPAGWESARLEELTSKIGSGATPKGGERAYKQAGTPLIRSLNVHFDGFRHEGIAYLDDQQADLLRNVEVRVNDILLNITGASIGRVTVAPPEMNGARVNQHVCIVRPVDGVESSFVRSYFASPIMQAFITDENYGVTRQALTKEMIENFDIPLPPLPEQRRIVETIEALTARSRRAREALDALPALIDRYRQSILAAAFRGDLTAEWREQGADCRSDTADDRPDSLPTGWGWQRLDSMAAVTGGLTKNKDRERFALRRPYLRVANVYADELRLDDIQEIGVASQELARVLLQSGDLLIVEGNGSLDQIGRVAIWNGQVPDCVHQNHIIKVRFPERRFAEFALLWLLSPLGRKHIEQEASSTAGLHTLSLSKISRLPIPVPTIDEADAIVSRVRAALRNLSRFAKPVAEASSRLSTLDQSILAKAFRGELVPQDPEDEPASVLLERIRAERAAVGVVPRRGRRARPE